VGLYEDGQPGELFITMAKEGSTVGGLMDVIGTCTSMALQYGVPLITLVDKFRHARFEPSGMTSNKDIPFAKSLIDYIFCWLGCQFIPGYADKNMPNRAAAPPVANNIATAKELVEKTRDLAQKITEATTIAHKKQEAAASTPISARPLVGVEPDRARIPDKQVIAETSETAIRISAEPTQRMEILLGSMVTDGSGALQAETAVMEQFNAQFAHFSDDAPACDVCGSITVRNGTCFKCYNCGNSMGCS
jgi:ribonucleoside-diphosphate reductase alpha chain